MQKITISRDEAIRQIAAVERALEEGYEPPSGKRGGRNRDFGALKIAASREKISVPTLYSRMGRPGHPGILKRYFNLEVDWKKYKPPPPPAAPQINPSDKRFTLLQDEIRELRDQLRKAHRASSTEEIIREIVGRIADAPRQPPKWITESPKRERHKPMPEVPITIWSDWHLGEIVERAEVNGFNSFNFEVAEIRVNRLIDTTIKLCRENHTGIYPGIVVNLLGDFVSGGIQPELLVTDEDEVIPCSLRAADWLIAGLKRFADEFGRVYVPCATGNHGRLTAKPEFKRYYRKNFDWLIIQIVARHFESDKRIHFDIRPSNDVHYRVYGERYLACHGDMLGVRGGDGIIGSIGPIVRGEVKQAGQSQALGFGFDRLVIGHWHQRLWLPRAIVNNALKGFDEYAMKALGAKPDRPTQALWFVHPGHGQTAQRDVYLDDRPQRVADWVSWKDKI